MPRGLDIEAPSLQKGTRSRPTPVKERKAIPRIAASKKERKKKKSPTSTKLSKPTYYNMIKQALIDDKAHYSRGTSRQRLMKLILSRYQIKDEAVFKRFFKISLKRAVENGNLSKPRLHSYALTKTTGTSTPKKPRSSNPGSAKKLSVTKKKPKIFKKISVHRSVESDNGGLVEKNFNPEECVWYWQYEHDGWRNFYPDASQQVEETYQTYLKEAKTGRIIDVREVKSGEWAYMIDFRGMTQTNIQHSNHTIRNIRRVFVPPPTRFGR